MLLIIIIRPLFGPTFAEAANHHPFENLAEGILPMFGLFRKTRKALVGPAVVPGALQMVPVRRSTFEGSTQDGRDLVREVVHFVNKLQSKVNEVGGEIPPLALQSYYTEQYVSLAVSQGHRTYFDSCGDGFAAMTSEALAGLKAMGATDHVELLEDMVALFHPSKMGAAFDGLDEELSVLDDELTVIESDRPQSQKNADWIRGWLILQVIEDDDYKTALIDSVRSGPMFAASSAGSDDLTSELSEAQKEFAMLRNSEMGLETDIREMQRLR